MEGEEEEEGRRKSDQSERGPRFSRFVNLAKRVRFQGLSESPPGSLSGSWERFASRRGY